MKYIDAEKLIAEIERKIGICEQQRADAIKVECYNLADDASARMGELRVLLETITSLQQEQPGFPTTDKEVENLLASHPKVELPDKYKTPDWLLKKQEQPQVADASKMEHTEVDLEKEFQEYWYLHHYDQRLRRQVVDGHGKAVLKNVARHFYELRNRALEEAARNIYESWKGGTMDDFLRDMVELGKALNATKEEQQ